MDLPDASEKTESNLFTQNKLEQTSQDGNMVTMVHSRLREYCRAER
jgi:hypothetical protein